MCSSLAVGVPSASHRHLEVGSSLVLKLVCQWVDLKAIQPGSEKRALKNVMKSLKT